MLDGSGLRKFLWGEMMFTTAFLGNRASHSAIGVQFPFKMLHETEPDLKLVGVIIALDVVHVGGYSKHHELKAVEGSWLGSWNYYLHSLDFRRIIDSRNAIFIKTSSPLLPRLLEETSQQVNPPQETSWTSTTTLQKTTFCSIFAIKLPCWNRSSVFLLTTSP